MNKVILIGNLAADPESRTTQSGVAQCTLRLAVQRRFANAQGQQTADAHGRFQGSHLHSAGLCDTNM